MNPESLMARVANRLATVEQPEGGTEAELRAETERLHRLALLTQEAMQIGQGPLMECVAVPHPGWPGCFYMERRPIHRQGR